VTGLGGTRRSVAVWSTTATVLCRIFRRSERQQRVDTAGLGDGKAVGGVLPIGSPEAYDPTTSCSGRSG
jgi:hypothetical protein